MGLLIAQCRLSDYGERMLCEVHGLSGQADMCSSALAIAIRDWEALRRQVTNLQVKVDDLEHENGELQEKLRRISGYVNSVVLYE